MTLYYSLHRTTTVSRRSNTTINNGPYDDAMQLHHARPKSHKLQNSLRSCYMFTTKIRPRWRKTNGDMVSQTEQSSNHSHKAPRNCAVRPQRHRTSYNIIIHHNRTSKVMLYEGNVNVTSPVRRLWQETKTSREAKQACPQTSEMTLHKQCKQADCLTTAVVGAWVMESSEDTGRPPFTTEMGLRSR